tara:strand:+ start:75 stop:257 length:183 start_codon:yes stop_codon:yes gene_type:complete
MFDYKKFGHMTKEELLFSFKQYEGTGVTYKVMGKVAHDCGRKVGKLSVIFSFEKSEKEDG